MYKIYNGAWYYFNTLAQLINWLSQFNERYGTEVANSILENTRVSAGDTKIVWGYPIKGSISQRVVYRAPREFLIVDENDHSLYCNSFIQKVHTWVYSDSIHKEWKRDFPHKYRWSYWSIPDNAKPEFRRGPVHHVHKMRGGCYCKSIKTFNEVKHTSSPEMRSYNRGSRGENLPDPWDYERARGTQDNWKAQGKHEHQWEHSVICKEKHALGKGVYVDKPVTEEIETDED